MGDLVHNKQEGEDISLLEIKLKLSKWYHYILSKWVLIFIMGFLGGALGFTYAYFKRPIYTATTTFVLEESDKGGGLGQYAGLASMVGVDLAVGGGGIFQGDNILELYKSKTMIRKTLLTQVTIDGKKQLLIENFIKFNNLRDKWSKNEELKKLKFDSIEEINSQSKDPNLSRAQDSIMSVIVKEINKTYLDVAKPDKKLSIIQADVNAPNEQFAKVFNEQIVKNVNDFYVQTRTKKSLDNITILQQKTDSVRNMINGAIYSAAAVSDATPNLNATRQSQRSAPVQKSQFSVEANKVILGELVKNLELSKISLRKETPLIQVIDEPVFPLEKKTTGRISSTILGFIILSLLAITYITLRYIISQFTEK